MLRKKKWNHFVFFFITLKKEGQVKRIALWSTLLCTVCGGCAFLWLLSSIRSEVCSGELNTVWAQWALRWNTNGDFGECVCVSWRPAEWRATPLYVCLSAHRSSAALHCSLTHTPPTTHSTDVWQPVSQHRHGVMEGHCMLKMTPIWSDLTKRNKNA